MYVRVIDDELRGRVQQLERPFLRIESADEQQHATAGRHAKRRECNRRRIREALDVNAIGNHRHLGAGQTADLRREIGHVAADADVPRYQPIGEAIEPEPQAAAFFRHANTGDNHGNAGRGSRQASHDVRVKQEGLQDRGPKHASRCARGHTTKKSREAPRSQADDVDARRPQLVDQDAPGVETKYVRFPAAAIKSRYDLHKRPLGPTRVEVGDAKGDPRGLRLAG